MTRPAPTTTLHHIAVLALLSTRLPTLVTAEDLDAEDVPPECAALCAPIVQLTERCEAQTEARFGDVGKRWGSSSTRSGTAASLEKQRRRRAMGRRRRRQAESDSDSDSEDEGGGPPAAVVAAAAAAERDCVCGERGFDVPAVMGSCAVCIVGNVTAVDANEVRLQHPSTTAAAGLHHGARGRESSRAGIERGDLDVAAVFAGTRDIFFAIFIFNVFPLNHDNTAGGGGADANTHPAAARRDSGPAGPGFADAGAVDYARDGVRDAFVPDAAESRSAERFPAFEE
ncbi:hypothetical protein CkaCkLH20_10124 [Colletotrichum karsti]|uniref:Uncharacterized protein n=1 Tax=Colletotrichum karsti TaxID=1095194 RepID=A0A9P6LH90_9PEZI|nr:uncharacterized protein CkaCkLH20_10124 [Colletotrichum karsti]KAF9872297.1 hypothetical protein CkaCkLH20_10124 [Colletotrichum karsti]